MNVMIPSLVLEGQMKRYHKAEESGVPEWEWGDSGALLYADVDCRASSPIPTAGEGVYAPAAVLVDFTSINECVPSGPTDEEFAKWHAPVWQMLNKRVRVTVEVIGDNDD